MKKLFYLIGIALFLISVQFSYAEEIVNVYLKALLTTPPNYIGKCPKTIKFTGSTITVEPSFYTGVGVKFMYRVILQDRYILQDPRNDNLGPYRFVTFHKPGTKSITPEFKFEKAYKGSAILVVWGVQTQRILAESAPVMLDIKCATPPSK
jgi:hypothetical protein